MAFLWTFLEFLIDIFSGGLFGYLLAFVCAFAIVCNAFSYVFDFFDR